jgi:hypothetical protein
LAVSVARVIWCDSLAKIADTKIIGIDTQWDIWYNLSSVSRWPCMYTKPIVMIFLACSYQLHSVGLATVSTKFY